MRTAASLAPKFLTTAELTTPGSSPHHAERSMSNMAANVVARRETIVYSDESVYSPRSRYYVTREQEVATHEKRHANAHVGVVSRVACTSW